MFVDSCMSLTTVETQWIKQVFVQPGSSYFQEKYLTAPTYGE